MKKLLLLLLLFPTILLARTQTVVYDVTDDRVVQGWNSNDEVSIASISKLMTVYTVLKHGQDMDEKLTVTGNRTPNTFINKGMTLTRKELVELALISSDNLAAQTLAQNFPGGMSYFVYTMNEHANRLGMSNTGFVEPTGLSPMNFSSIKDIVALTKAVSEFDIVQSAAQAQRVKSQYVIETKKKNKTVNQQKPKGIVNNPTSIFFGRQGVITIKTGFTKAAGFCITMLVQANNKLYNITVLGAKSKKERQQIVEQSLKEIYNT